MIVYWVSLVIITRTTYGIHLKLRQKLEGLAYENRQKSKPLAYVRPIQTP